MFYPFKSLETVIIPKSITSIRSWSFYQCSECLGLKPNDCYNPNTYKGDCDELEYLQKKCLAFHCCEEPAKIVYDNGGGVNRVSRKERVQANKELQVCLRKNAEALSIMGCEVRKR